MISLNNGHKAKIEIKFRIWNDIDFEYMDINAWKMHKYSCGDMKVFLPLRQFGRLIN